ncbi:hypothetical protein L249_2863 [Ophiocordyceps polyrhachis-furcata BCC 54312]|uniref:Uncharacterized protein n=1 Tax=Ophiocordyceps polyrhachis-furcata BCC 54312 TaxID=1330021 RepID=A0A367LPR1_9HYPO|nr:hypothetical protein L249_2863 [Ophiocordyceps polyrhachis-furcata BCC 54312]
MKLAIAIISSSFLGTMASTACGWKGCPIRGRIASPSASKTDTDRFNNPCGGNFATEPASNHPLPDTLPHGCQRSGRARKTAAAAAAAV